MSTLFAKFHSNESVSRSMILATKSISILFGLLAFIILLTENSANIQPLTNLYSLSHLILMIITISTISVASSIGVLYMLLVLVSKD